MAWTPSVLFLTLSLGAAQTTEPANLQGTWRITALVDNGSVLSNQQIESDYVRDRLVQFQGPLMTFASPHSLELRKLPFVVDTKTSPMSFDLSGGEKVGPRGIMTFQGDSLIVCIAHPDKPDRPTEFASAKDSGRVLITLQRVTPTPNTPAAPVPLPPPPVSGDQATRKSLIGTWGNQDDRAISYTTLNADGSFSSVLNWKKGFDNIFLKDVRSSGTWTVENGVVIARVTASTDPERRNQVYSFRIMTLSPTEFYAIDGRGRGHREWRVR